MLSPHGKVVTEWLPFLHLSYYFGAATNGHTFHGWRKLSFPGPGPTLKTVTEFIGLESRAQAREKISFGPAQPMTVNRDHRIRKTIHLESVNDWG